MTPILTKHLGLSPDKKAELDQFQVDRERGFSTFIWMIAERIASAESFKEVSLTAESIEKII